VKTLDNNYSIESADLGKWPKLALIGGLIGLVVTIAILVLVTPEHKGIYLRSYLVGFMFWFNMAAGCLFWLMVQHLSGGAWGVMIRRVTEAGSKMMVWSLIFIIPVLLGMHYLYEWSHPDIVKADHTLSQKAAYLNVPGFYIRLVIYAVIWAFLAYRLSGLSTKQDKAINPKLTLSMKRWSAGGLLLLLMTMTFAALDWLLSLEPHFSSSMYGPIILTGQALGSMAFIVALLVVLVSREPMRSRLTSGHVHDLGNFLLAATMFWAYVNFAQFLIIWGANVAEQVPYYLRRMTGGWGVVGAGLIAFHFFAPFFLLLNRKLKKDIHVLVKVAYWILFLRFVDLCWLILPSASHSTFHGHMEILSIIVAAVAVLGIGGLWLVLFFKFLVKRPLLPANDPYLQEALEFRGGH
jgi:hypothetical protein